jgi:predicted transposase/invertase (TIGR01784 family)
MRRLMDDLAVLQSTKTRVAEAFMTHQIPATSTEQRHTYQEVIDQGRKEAREAFARKLLARGMSLTEVAELTELTEEQVRALTH